MTRPLRYTAGVEPLSSFEFEALNETLFHFPSTSTVFQQQVEDVEDIGKSFNGELALAAPLKDNVHIFLGNSDMTEPGHVNTGAGAVEREPPKLKILQRKKLLEKERLSAGHCNEPR